MSGGVLRGGDASNPGGLAGVAERASGAGDGDARMRRTTVLPLASASVLVTGDGSDGRTEEGKVERAAPRGCVQREDPPRGLRIGLGEESTTPACLRLWPSRPSRASRPSRRWSPLRSRGWSRAARERLRLGHLAALSSRPWSRPRLASSLSSSSRRPRPCSWRGSSWRSTGARSPSTRP